MRAVKQSFKYGITSALLVILLGGVQACADASPTEPGARQLNAQYSATAAGDTVWVDDESIGPTCMVLNGQWYCSTKTAP